LSDFGDIFAAAGCPIAREPGTKNIYDLDWELRDLLKKQFNRDIDICTEKYIKPYCRPYVLRDAIYV